MGTTSVTLSNDVVLDGVWSDMRTGSEQDDGGLQYNMVASVIVAPAAGIDKTLHGKTCTYNGESLRVGDVVTGDTHTTIYFEHDTEFAP